MKRALTTDWKGKLITAGISLALSLGGSAIALETRVSAASAKIAGMDARLQEVERGTIQRHEFNRFEHDLDLRLRDINAGVRDIQRLLMTRGDK